MNRTAALVFTLSLVATCLPGRTSAHHSFAMFDSSKTISIEGTVKDFAWKNPHVIIWVATPAKDGKPEGLWSVETTSPGNLTRAGWSRRTFNPGDRVKLDIRPLRNGETGGQFVRATLTDTGKVVEAGSQKEYAKPDAE